MRVLSAPRVALEPQTVAHADAMFVVLSDPAIYEYENEPPPSLMWLCERFARLESRQSADGREQWLNWVIRMPTSELAGFVQSTVHANGVADIAYVLSSAYWGRGLAQEAVETMIAELVSHYHVRALRAVFKNANDRSKRLLERLGFAFPSPEQDIEYEIEPDELLMILDVGGG